MAKYTVLVTDETVFSKVIDVPDDRDPQDFADEDFMNNQESYSIQNATYAIELIPQETANEQTQSN